MFLPGLQQALIHFKSRLWNLDSRENQLPATRVSLQKLSQAFPPDEEIIWIWIDSRGSKNIFSLKGKQSLQLHPSS